MTIVRTAVAFTATALLGCSGQSGVTVNPDVPKEAVELSKELGGLLSKVKPAAESGELASLFASGGEIPKDPRSYSKYSFSLGQLPQTGSDDLKATVDIGVPNMGDPWQSQWTFKKQDGEWKIGAAPLPTGHVSARQSQSDRD
jgi:hypothetical protein